MSDKSEVQTRDHKDLWEKQNCLSCKIFGSAACLAMAGYTAYWSLRQQAQYRGLTRLIYSASCFALASGLTYLGVKRILD
ncbi:hypothetical transcript [Echinococcus multilocularis]|uniref:Hypothetical transcript n=1 Tax=Echinococcus multilocularis TaxID=6211 RepID=A0A087W1V6_ECHMU|nr:hypothetical transcript [Echinococcus multilocularis]